MTSAVKDIIAIIPDKAGACPLSKASVKEIAIDNCGSIYEGKYCVVDNQEEKFTIKMNFTPEETFDENSNPTARLLLHYYPNFRVYSDEGFSEFSDYEEGRMSIGKWKLPSDWHMLIVQGVIATLYPELKPEWERQCELKAQQKFTNADLKLKSVLGLSTGRRGR